MYYSLSTFTFYLIFFVEYNLKCIFLQKLTRQCNLKQLIYFCVNLGTLDTVLSKLLIHYVLMVMLNLTSIHVGKDEAINIKIL